MGTIDNYRRIIQNIITEYAQFGTESSDVEMESVFDIAQDHYELIRVGWRGLDRVHSVIIHVDIRDDKVLVQRDGTEVGVAEEMVRAGIPRERIVLAFKPPDIRPHTDFAIA